MKLRFVVNHHSATSAKTRLAVLLGEPVGHSRSPIIMNAAFAARGIDAHYLAWSLPKNALSSAIRTLATVNALGANVTVPHKESVLAAVDHLADEAAAIGCSNCLAFEAGQVTGHNTDVWGFGRSLEDLASTKQRRQWLRTPIAVLGAGGAARAVVYGLLQRGAEAIVVVGRDDKRRARFKRFVSTCGASRRVAVEPWPKSSSRFSESRLVVHATSAVVRGEGLLFDLSKLHRETLVYDLTYGDAERQTPLTRAAAKLGLATTDGYSMLLYQAAKAFELWTGKKAPLAAMRAA